MGERSILGSSAARALPRTAPVARYTLRPVRSLPALLLLLAACASPGEQEPEPPPRFVDWPRVGNDPGATRYSRLDQIHRGNVDRLEVAWTYRTGELDPSDGSGKTIECTPLVIDGVLYLTTGRLRAVALDATTGRELWTFDPFAESSPGPRGAPLASGGVNRGLAHWSDGEPDGARRILLGSADGRLFSLDAHTGIPDPAFGDGGAVDLRAGIDRDLSKLPYGPTSAPAVFEDLVILGFSTGEGPGVAAPGDVRAFEVRTGAEAWRFRTVPRPPEFGHQTWAEGAWEQRGGANAWGGISVDAERGWAFFGLGSASFDFYGGDRHGANLFANSTVAVDARTGERVWYYQTVHHDLWDHDLPVYPNLVTVDWQGEPRDAVAQVTKTGYVFLFDRETGVPLFPVEELPVAPSDVPGEAAWPTQPVPLAPPPICRVVIGEEDLTRRTPEVAAAARERFAGLRSGPDRPPPSLQGTLVVPGFHGGATWSGASFDPTTGLLYVNSNELPYVVTLREAPEGRRWPYEITGYHQFRDADGYPAIEPPWGRLTAIDLARGTFAWQVVLGEHPELTAQGVPQTGTESFGGTIVTAGGLVFIGGTADERFHAFDSATGELLWEAQLPAGGYATPCTYLADGRQFVVIAAGGAGKMGTRAGDAFVAFALPEAPSPPLE